MTLEYFYLKFKSKKECIEFIEDLEWSDTPFCPYCNSERFTNLKDEKRYHCNNCNNSYSVTVGTIFHKTKIDLQKWFYVIHLLYANKIKLHKYQADKYDFHFNT